ncbi:MAG: beta-galactosidase [Flavobacteriaceae bacterium]|nr:beta-galactosidase [Flavobacteriaceae bacterium]
MLQLRRVLLMPSTLLLTFLYFSCSLGEKKGSAFDQNELQKSNLDKLNEQFYLGSHLAREPMPPMAEMKRDMEILKSKGFNLIKLQQSWGADEQIEGQYDFSKYEELIAYAKELEMYVYFGLTMEQAPAWLYEKYPDARMVSRSGLTIMHEAQAPVPADGKPGPNFDHPGVKSAQKKFIKALVETLGKHDNILVWNTWQEIGYWSEQIVGETIDYSDYTLSTYRDWLKETYRSLDSLNGQWNTRYKKWEHIKPNRGYKRRFTMPQEVSFSYFMDNIKITRTLEERMNIIKQYDPFNRPVFTHLGSWNYGSGKDWRWARANDFLGSSSYPASNWGEFDAWDDGIGSPPIKHIALKHEIWRMLALRLDFLRSSNPEGNPVWSAEFQGGPVSTGFHKGRVPSKDDMRRWLYTSIGAGVNTISFWVTRAEIMIHETNGFSLLDSDGQTTERLDEVARIGNALIKHQDIFSQPSYVGGNVAIFINEDNHQICKNMLNGGQNLEYSTRGWHRLLWEQNIPVDFIESSYLDEIDLSQYNMIIMPFPLSISDNSLEKLGNYVREGGNLVSEAGIARYSKDSYSIRGEMSQAAQELFGVRQVSFTMVREPNNEKRWSPWDRTWGEFLESTFLQGTDVLEGDQTLANVYIQTYAPINSIPILKYNNRVAGTVRDHGQGKAWLLGTYVGHNGNAYKNESTNQFVEKLLALCNVHSLHDGEFFIRKRKIEGKEAIIITNPTARRLTENISVGTWSKATNLFDQPLEIVDQTIEISLESLDVEIILLQ